MREVLSTLCIWLYVYIECMIDGGDEARSISGHHRKRYVWYVVWNCPYCNNRAANQLPLHALPSALELCLFRGFPFPCAGTLSFYAAKNRRTGMYVCIDFAWHFELPAAAYVIITEPVTIITYPATVELAYLMHPLHDFFPLHSLSEWLFTLGLFLSLSLLYPIFCEHPVSWIEAKTRRAGRVVISLLFD